MSPKHIDVIGRLDYAVRVHRVVERADPEHFTAGNYVWSYLAKCGVKGKFLRTCRPKDEPKCPTCWGW